ncbi:site-specific integrase [Jeongeupia chitinilytica]|uniref:Tyr recombinase domain-containing protein n=1 Tax=Jeongeupia chitinilytica TaxID=1041641 RepID=A0ABQ3GVT5_9NEIS|nr:site-specific integrase [Jeongeupia chitinilytica]GHD55018.1 hypothetical protein GCM10007350_00110 [Jeongeupia chitinilytica]
MMVNDETTNQAEALSVEELKRMRTDRDALRKIVNAEKYDWSKSTLNQYSAIWERVRKSNLNPLVFLNACASKPSYDQTRAAIRFRCLEKSKQYLVDWGRLDQGSDAENYPALVELNKKILEVYNFLSVILPKRACDEIARSGKSEFQCKVDKGVIKPGKTKKKGKRRSIIGLSNDWQVAVLKKIPEQHREAFVIQTLTGCRPRELKLGVEIGFDPNTQEYRILIQGAKVTAKNGQPTRTIRVVLDEAHEVYRDVLDQLVQQQAQQQKQYVMMQTTKAYGMAVTRAAAKLEMKKLSPYSLRHQVASDLKASDRFTEEQVAEVMGHCSTKTQGCYGRKSTGGHCAVVGADAARQVRTASRTTATRSRTGSSTDNEPE